VRVKWGEQKLAPFEGGSAPIYKLFKDTLKEMDCMHPLTDQTKQQVNKVKIKIISLFGGIMVKWVIRSTLKKEILSPWPF